MCDRGLIINKHGYLSIHHKTAAKRVKNNLDAPRVIAHCKQHGFIQKQDRQENEHKLYEIDRSQSKNQSWNKENQAKLDFLLCLVKYSVPRNEPQETLATTA